MLFRGKFLAEVHKFQRAQQFDAFSEFRDPQGYERLRRKVHAKPWNVYSKAPFGNADHVFRYLGRYTHRIGIANSRIVSADDALVTFRTKDGKTASLPPAVFLERLLQHVLPHQFVKIRHYGLYASANVNEGLERARADLAGSGDDPKSVTVLPKGWLELLLDLARRDVRVCDACGGRVVMRPLPAAPRRARSPPVSRCLLDCNSMS